MEQKIPPENDNTQPPPEKKVVEDVADVSVQHEEIKIQDVVATKKKKEKKPLEVIEENVILEQNEIEKAFYEEQPKPNFGYRRGITL